MSYNGDKIAAFASESDNLNTYDKHGSGSFHLESDDISQENDGKSRITAPLSVYHMYEAKLAGLLSKNGILELEGQLAAALASREAAEKNLSSALKSRKEIEN
ncbi:unnamed protein product [Fraxinus pennsylvanica]|uniref:Uncharacterized protein n=1 Tax=Fraxinus pennsylvanica TaxID=56036 RepID=A0AAD1ZWC6_9LAMI|nr:unnamed protein product [Fraxinus pennsylvanica]